MKTLRHFIASLLIQGFFCANYFLNSGYTMQSVAASACAYSMRPFVTGCLGTATEGTSC